MPLKDGVVRVMGSVGHHGKGITPRGVCVGEDCMCMRPLVLSCHAMPSPYPYSFFLPRQVRFKKVNLDSPSSF